MRVMNLSANKNIYIMFEWGWILFHVEGNLLDIITFKYLRDTSMEKASKHLARDLAEFFEECGGVVEWGAKDG